MTTELFVEDKRVDLTADISSLLTFALDDVKDFATRQTAFSKTIVLPGTANNNKLFGQIFEIGISNDYTPLLTNIGYNFNAAKSAKCYLFQDNLQAFKGTLRLLEITKDRGNIEYEVALNGELTSLNVALSSGFLTDLDFSQYDRAYTVANIEASWNNAPGSGVYFPLIDYGNCSLLKHDWSYKAFRPALYVKEYIDKMFAAANFKYQSALFNTERFKRLIIPHNQKKLQALNTRLLSTSRNNAADVINSGTPPVVPLQYSSFEGSIFTVTNSNSRFTYNGTDPVNLTLTLSLFGNYIANSIGYYMYLTKNGAEIPGTRMTLAQAGDTTTRYYTWNVNTNISLGTNDYLETVFAASAAFGTGADFLKASSGNLFLDSATAVATEVTYSMGLQMNLTIPKNIRQIDFLVSIVKLFNLYVYESKFDERLIYITPFIDFYSIDAGSSVDWTYKLNRDAPIRIKPLSELNSKIYNFNYKDDNDYYNELYKKRYNKGYGSHTFDSKYEFASQTNKLELIFASTPLVGYQGEDKIYPTIFKRTGNDTLVEENIDSVIRIMQTKKIGGVTPWNIVNGTSVVGSYTTYGYAGHFDDPDNPDNDLNFGALEELFFILRAGNLTKTQFNLYWSSYMAEITNKDSKMLIAKFYLTPKDIFNLDFSKYVLLDGVLFRLNKIIDYNASIPDVTVVELIRVINTTYSFPPIPPVPTETFYLLWDDGQKLLYDNLEKTIYK